MKYSCQQSHATMTVGLNLRYRWSMSWQNNWAPVSYGNMCAVTSNNAIWLEQNCLDSYTIVALEDGGKEILFSPSRRYFGHAYR